MREKKVCVTVSPVCACCFRRRHVDSLELVKMARDVPVESLTQACSVSNVHSYVSTGGVLETRKKALKVAPRYRRVI